MPDSPLEPTPETPLPEGAPPWGREIKLVPYREFSAWLDSQLRILVATWGPFAAPQARAQDKKTPHVEFSDRKPGALAIESRRLGPRRRPK